MTSYCVYLHINYPWLFVHIISKKDLTFYENSWEFTGHEGLLFNDNWLKDVRFIRNDKINNIIIILMWSLEGLHHPLHPGILFSCLFRIISYVHNQKYSTPTAVESSLPYHSFLHLSLMYLFYILLFTFLKGSLTLTTSSCHLLISFLLCRLIDDGSNP